MYRHLLSKHIFKYLWTKARLLRIHCSYILLVLVYTLSIVYNTYTGLYALMRSTASLSIYIKSKISSIFPQGTKYYCTHPVCTSFCLYTDATATMIIYVMRIQVHKILPLVYTFALSPVTTSGNCFLLHKFIGKNMPLALSHQKIGVSAYWFYQ